MASSATTVLPVPDVAHEQPVHALRRRHVRRNLRQGLFLVAGELPGQRFAEAPREGRVAHLSQPALVALGERAGARQHQLHIEQLIEGKATAPEFRLRRTGRAVHDAQRLGQGGQAQGQAPLRWQQVGDERNEGIEVPVDQRADLPMSQSFGGRIDREDQAFGCRLRVVGVAEDDELARRHLPAVIEPHRPRHEQQLSLADGAVEEGLAGPDALEQSRIVAQHRMKDPETLPRREHTLGHDAAHGRDLIADTGLCQRREGRCVEIAMGEVPDEVERGADAEAGERVGPLLAHTLEELDRGVGAER